MEISQGLLSKRGSQYLRNIAAFLPFWTHSKIVLPRVQVTDISKPENLIAGAGHCGMFFLLWQGDWLHSRWWWLHWSDQAKCGMLLSRKVGHSVMDMSQR